MKLSQKIAKWMKKQVGDAGKNGIVLGLSGGLDSAVVLALSKFALGENVLGLIMPCNSSAKDAELAREAAKTFDIKTKEVCLDDIYEEFVKVNPDANNVAKANLKPRMRMMMLYYFANSLNYLVVGTGNKSEIVVGYFTKHGDGGVDMLPLGDLLKRDVVKLAEELNVPGSIIARPPSAGLWEGQTDESEMGITYEKLDETIASIEKNDTKDIDKKILEKVKKMMAVSRHKRVSAPIFVEKEG